jgi:chromosome segregation ATPase
MSDFYDDDDAVANLIERRWFAASAKVRALQDECEVLREVMDQAAMAYRGARAQLAQLEALRDGLGQRLAHLDEVRQPLVVFTESRGERSAA